MTAAERQNRRALALFAQHGRTPRTVAHRNWGNLNRTRNGETLLPKRHPAEHGDISRYRQHVRDHEPPCGPCAAAHLRDVEDSRARRSVA